MAAETDRVELTDPRAIRALAHPARQRIIEELYGGRVLTATECAELAGLTPSATSYHLRALARWGIVVRADGSGDGRERPWRAPARQLSISSEATVAGRTARRALVQGGVDRLLEQLDELTADDPWDSVVHLRRGGLWLTRAEAEQLGQDLRDLLDAYQDGRSEVDHPADARRVGTLIALIPLGPPPTEADE